jgi:hypothetical protein
MPVRYTANLLYVDPEGTLIPAREASPPIEFNMEDKLPPADDASLISIYALGVYSLGMSDFSEGSLREITEKIIAPIIAVPVIPITRNFLCKSTAKKSIKLILLI